MDFESFVFDLAPLFDLRARDIAANRGLSDKLVARLDELAVALRSDFNRDLVRESGLLVKLCAVKYDVSIINVFSEIVRCLANGVADNDKNRSIVGENVRFLETIGSFIAQFDAIADEDRHYEIGKRSLILLRNLFLNDIPTQNSVLQDLVSSFVKFFVKNSEAILEEPRDEYYLSESSKIVFDLFNSFLDDENIYTVESFYESCVPPYSTFMTLLERYAGRVSRMKDFFLEENEEVENDEDENDYEEPNDLTNLVLVSEIMEKLLKKSIQITKYEEDVYLSGLRLLFSALKILENCSFQFPSKLILLRRISFLIQSVTSNLALDLPENDFRCQIPSALEFYSFERIFSLFEEISMDVSAKQYQLSCVSFVISNMLENKSTLKKWQHAYSISNYIKLVCETFKFSDPYLYIPVLDLIRKSISIINIIEDASCLESLWKLCNDHIVERLDMIHDLARFYKLLLNKILAVEYGNVLFESNILSYEKLYSKDYVVITLLISKLSKYLLQSSMNEKLLDLIERATDGVIEEKKDFSNILPEFFKAIGVYIREYSLLNNSTLPFYLSENKHKFIQIAARTLETKNTQSPAAMNNLKFCVGMIFSNENVKAKFTPEDVSALNGIFAELDSGN